MSLQGQTVSQAGSVLPEIPAKPQTVRAYGKESTAGVSDSIAVRLRHGLRLQAQTHPARATPPDALCWTL
ncbi:MAG TPA: hypothetical protein VIF82_17205 [Burkholderiaceae bacterium]